MVNKLGKLGDRLLTRLVPKVQAEAASACCAGHYCYCQGKYPKMWIRVDDGCNCLCTQWQCA